MQPIKEYEQVNEEGIHPIPVGAYVMKITEVIDNAEKQYLEIYCDVAQGEHKDFFKNIALSTGTDYSRSFRSYKTSALAFFKRFIVSVEKSNQGYQWNWDEKSLIGKTVVAVFGEEEYVAKDGSVKTNVKVQEFRSVQALKEGRIEIPAKKVLTEEQKAAALKKISEQTPATSAATTIQPLDDDELPF